MLQIAIPKVRRAVSEHSPDTSSTTLLLHAPGLTELDLPEFKIILSFTLRHKKIFTELEVGVGQCLSIQHRHLESLT